MAVGTKDLASDNLRGFGDDRLVEELRKAKEELFNLRFQAAVPGGLEKTHRVDEIRKDIARIKTLLASRKTAV